MHNLVNHLRTPWLADNLHRAMYSSEKYPTCRQPANWSTHILQELELLFHEHQADICNSWTLLFVCQKGILPGALRR